MASEYCCECGELTGRAGRGEDSLYDEDQGPYCPECWEERTEGLYGATDIPLKDVKGM